MPVRTAAHQGFTVYKKNPNNNGDGTVASPARKGRESRSHKEFSCTELYNPYIPLHFSNTVSTIQGDRATPIILLLFSFAFEKS